MARARNLKPGYFKNEDLPELGIEVHFLFSGLWTIADKKGRLEDRPKRIKVECVPFYEIDVDNCLSKLDEAGFIHRYEVDGKKYIQISTWHKHQTPHHKEVESEIPSPAKKPVKTLVKINVDSSMDQPCVNVDLSLPQAPEEVRGKRESESKEEGIKEEDGLDSGKRDSASEVAKFVEAFNAIDGIPKVRAVTGERLQKLKAKLRLKTWPWREALSKIPIPGDGWQPDFDWIVANETNVHRLIEGKYDWRQRAGPKTFTQQRLENSKQAIKDFNTNANY